MSDPAPPLVTFALFTYNQEAYVQQAVVAAFAQTYYPLEIIISDDASSDATAAIIRKLVEAYDGPHRVLVNLNEENLGIGAHVNKLFQMAHGTLIVLAAGDDISLPKRVEQLVSLWLAHSPRSLAIHSAAHVINARGAPVATYASRLKKRENDWKMLISHYRGAMLLGATMAFDAELFRIFGPLRRDLPAEDVPLTVRAAMLGRVAYCDDPLVNYRLGIHGWLPNNGMFDSYTEYKGLLRFKARVDYLVVKQIMRDARKHGDQNIIAVARARLAETKYVLRISTDGKFRLAKLLRTCVAAGRAWPCLAWTIILCMSFPGKLYFILKRRILPRLDSAVFQQK